MTVRKGHDLEMATNCLGPLLFNSFLEPILKRTAASAPIDSVRIVWLSSLLAVSVPRDGIMWDEKSGQPKILKNRMESYMESKAGNMFIASQLASRLSRDGIVNLVGHLAVLPGPATNPGKGCSSSGCAKWTSEEWISYAELYDGKSRSSDLR